jgi:DDE family transposase
MTVTKAISDPGAPDPTNGDDLKAAVNWVLAGSIFSGLHLHGNVKWTGTALLRLALFWVWDPDSSLVRAAESAIGRVRALFGAVAVGSYQALTSALSTYTHQLLPRVWKRLQYLTRGPDFPARRIGGWLPLAVDGSRVSVPRTASNENRFCKSAETKTKTKTKTKKGASKRTRRAGQKRSPERVKSHYNPQAVGPQMWLTLVWHIGLRVPWCWKVGPSHDSERAHLLALLAEETFPTRTLFCADAGFYGYAFWHGIRARGHHFLVRVGSNVHLLKNLGAVRTRGDLVYCWPDEQVRKKQPPLVLRLFRFHDGRGEVFLVTSVRDEDALTAEQASRMYRARWGIEVQFRALKQTYGRGKMRARTPDHAEVELHWSLVGLTVLQLLARKERQGREEPGIRTSVAAVLRIIRAALTEHDRPRAACDALPHRLAGATIDTYRRHTQKKSRNYPRRKCEPSAGAPHITEAQEKHHNALLAQNGLDLAA